MASAVLSDNLKCAICKDIFRDPRLLPCSHTFCTECLVQLHETQTTQGPQPDDIITCAVCRTPSTLPGDDVHSLPNNQTVKSLVDDYKTKQASPQKKTTSPTSTGEEKSCNYDFCDGGATGGDDQACSVCSTSEADVYCQRCLQYMCDSCLIQHNKITGNDAASHDIVSVAGIQSGKVRIQRPCALHPEERVRYVCIDCRSCVCFTCRMLEHDSHPVFDIAEYEDCQKAEAEILQEKAHDKIDEIQVYVAFVNQQRENITKVVTKVKQSINDAHTESVANLTKERDEYLRKCLSIEETLDHELDDMAEGQQRKMTEIQEKVTEIGESQEKFMRELTLPDESLAANLEKVLRGVELDDTKPVAVYSRATNLAFRRRSDGTQRVKELSLGQLDLGSY